MAFRTFLLSYEHILNRVTYFRVAQNYKTLFINLLQNRRFPSNEVRENVVCKCIYFRGCFERFYNQMTFNCPKQYNTRKIPSRRYVISQRRLAFVGGMQDINRVAAFHESVRKGMVGFMVIDFFMNRHITDFCQMVHFTIHRLLHLIGTNGHCRYFATEDFFCNGLDVGQIAVLVYIHEISDFARLRFGIDYH